MQTTRVLVCLLTLLLAGLLVGSLSCQNAPFTASNTSDPNQNKSNLGSEFDESVFLRGDCSPVDENGTPLTTMTVAVGSRVRFANSAAHVVTLLFPEELFGPTTLTLGPGSSETLAVRGEALGNSYFYGIEGCKRSSVVKTSPEIKVGGGGP